MKIHDLKIGDIVRIRDWDDMAAEFGETFGSIDTKDYVFVYRMKECCGIEAPIKHIQGVAIRLDHPKASRWIFTADMLEPASECLVEQPDTENFSSVLFGGMRGDAI